MDKLLNVLLNISIVLILIIAIRLATVFVLGVDDVFGIFGAYMGMGFVGTITVLATYVITKDQAKRG